MRCRSFHYSESIPRHLGLSCRRIMIVDAYTVIPVSEKALHWRAHDGRSSML